MFFIILALRKGMKNQDCKAFQEDTRNKLLIKPPKFASSKSLL